MPIIFWKKNRDAFSLIFSLIFGLIFGLSTLFTDAYASTDSYYFLSLINNSRAARALGLLAPNAALNAAAQQHAEDIAASGQFGHLGRNGSTVQERATSAGYHSYPDGILVAQSWATGHVEQAFATLLNQSADDNNIYSVRWREVGIGTAQTTSGTQIWVIVFGAQPGILPIFINHNQEVTHERMVTIQLHNETITQSESPFGYPVQMRMAEQGLLSKAPWQAWLPEVQFELSEGDGLKQVVVQLRDAQGRLVEAWDTITLDEANYFIAPSVETEARVDLTPTQAMIRATNTPSVREVTPSVSPTIVLTDWNIATPIVLLWPTVTPLLQETALISSPTVSPDAALNKQTDFSAELDANRNQMTSTPTIITNQTMTPTAVPNPTDRSTEETQSNFSPSPEPTTEETQLNFSPSPEPTMVFVEPTSFPLLSAISSPTIQLYETAVLAANSMATTPTISKNNATKSITLTPTPTIKATKTKSNSLAVIVTATPTPTSTAVTQNQAMTSAQSSTRPTTTPLALTNTASASVSSFSRQTIKRVVLFVALLVIEFVVLFAIARLLFLGGIMLRR